MPPLNSVFKDYFKTLQIDPDAEAEIITAAYYALMKKYHPDKNKHSLDYSKELNEAYEILSHPGKKKSYLEEYQRYSKKQKVLIKEVPQENSYHSQRGLLNRKSEELDAKEAELKKRELAINMKMKLMEEMHRFSENAQKNEQRMDFKALMEKFHKGAVKESRQVLEEIFSLNEKDRESVLERLFLNKIELEKELLLYQKLIQAEVSSPESFLEGAFKFKELYPELLDLIQRKKITVFKQKIAVLVKNTSFGLGNNTLLLPVLLDIYRWLFERESQLELLVKVQVLLEQKKLPEAIRENIILKFLQYLIDLQCGEYFQESIQLLKKDKHPLIEKMVKKVQEQI